MKKLAYPKKLINELNEFNETLDIHLAKVSTEYNSLIDRMTIYCDKLNKEYSQNLNKLVENIALGENLDVKMLKLKYIKGEVSIPSETPVVNTPISEDNDAILDKIIINNEEYYYEKKEEGNVYNKESVIVGKYRNNNIIII